MDITTKNRVSVEEMREYYAQHFAYAPTPQRVGRWARSIGFQLTKQMVNRKVIYFYIRINKMED